MKQEDIVIGRVYYSNYDRGHWYLKVTSIKIGQIDCETYMHNKVLYPDFKGVWGSFEQLKYGVRELTGQETEWYNHLMLTKKYIPFEEWVSAGSYQIY